MPVRRSIACALPASLAALLGATCLSPPAAAQTSFIAPDGHNRFPAVTIFCPSGNGVAPCVFGGGGSGGAGGAVTINLAGGAVSANNRFPVTDAALDALISGGALNVAGSLSVANFPGVQAVSQSGNWMVGLGAGASVAVSALPALPAGGNAIGSVSVSNLPAVQPVSGAVGQAGSWTVGLSSGSSVAVSALPSLPSGSNTIGAVTISGTPTFTCTGCGGAGSGAVSQGAGASANPWWMQGLGSAGTPAGGVISVQGVGGGAALPVSGAVSVSALPALPAGGNAIGSVSITGTPTVSCANCAGGGAGGAVTQPDVRATTQLAAGTANAAVTVPLQNGAATIGFTVTGLTASGATLTVEGSYDGGITWTPVQTVSALTGILTSTVAADRQFSVAAAGRTAVRLRVLAVGAGTITVADNVSVAPRDVSLAAPLPQGSNAIGSVSISNLPGTQTVSGAVSQAGSWSVGLASGSNVAVSALPALPAGGNAIGSVSISNLPGTQTVSGAVSQAGSWSVGLASGSNVAVSALPALPAGGNAIGSVSISNLPGTQTVSGAVSQAGSWSVGLASGSNVAVSALPALPAGANTIGAVTISGTPTFTCSGCGGSGGGAVTQGAGSSSNPWWMQGLGGAGAPAGGVVSVQGVSGGVALPVSGSVNVGNLPATQAVTAASLPLPAGAATAVGQAAGLAPVAPAAATATGANLVGCQAATALPAFTAGQQGAVPCDTSGRLYVVTVPSANNVPSYLQAVSSGGASVYRAINAASSTLAASVKTSSGMVYGYEGCNTGTAAVYLRLFAMAAAPTVGSSTPQVTKMLPAGACQTMTMSLGLAFSGGIALDVTSGSMADADTAAVASASQVAVEVYYK